MKHKLKIKTKFIIFVSFVLLFSSLYSTFTGLIFADSELFPSSNDAEIKNYSSLNDFTFSEDDSEILCYVGTSQIDNNDIKIKIPKKNRNEIITNIRDSAFSCNDLYKKTYPMRSEIVGIVIPETINSIGQNVFEAMPKLKWIIINSNDDLQIGDNFLGSQDNLPPQLEKIYLPKISKTTGILNDKVLPDKIEILYSEDCYSTKIYQDRESQGFLNEYDSEKHLKFNPDTKKSDFILENSGVFNSKIGFEITGENKNEFSVMVDNITLLDDEKIVLNTGESQRIVVKMNNSSSEDISDTRLKIINLSYDNKMDGNIDTLEEIVLDAQKKIEWPSASESLIYNGNQQTLINKDFIWQLSDNLKLQFSFDQTNWIDIKENSLPEKTDAGNYTIYFRLIAKDGKIVDVTNFNVAIAPKILKLCEKEDLLPEKIYDGKKSIQLSPENFILQGIEEKDVDGVNLDITNVKGSVTTPDVTAENNPKEVLLSGQFALTGNKANNYLLSEFDFSAKKLKVNITKKHLDITGKIELPDKIYDGTKEIPFEQNKIKIESDDICTKDDGTKDELQFIFDNFVVSAQDANAGIKNVCIDGIVKLNPECVDAKNYVLGKTDAAEIFKDLTVNIYKRKIKLDGNIKVADREYDGTTNLAIDKVNLIIVGEENPSFAIVDNDDVNLDLSNLKAVLDEEIGNVGKNKSVKIIGDVVLTGTSSGNYDLNNDFNRTSTVNIIPVPAEFVWSEKTKFNYDGNIHAVTAVVKNKKSENDVFNLKYDNNKEGNSGDYLARVIALGNENYTLENAKNVEKRWSIKDVFDGTGGGGGSSGGSSSSSDSVVEVVRNIKTNPSTTPITKTNALGISKKSLKDIIVPIHIKQKKYITGYPDKTFRPNGNMTRAELSQGIYNLINNNELIDINVLDKYNDIDKKAWYAKAMAYLSTKNIIKGYDGKIRPNDFVTRGEIAQILFDVLKSYDNTGANDYVYGNYDFNFIDVDNNYWASSAIKQLASNGMLNGYENKMFGSKINVTRAEVVAMISKVFGRNSGFDTGQEYIDVGKNHWAYNYILDASELKQNEIKRQSV